MPLTPEQKQRLNSLSPEDRIRVVNGIKRKRDNFIQTSTSEDIINSDFEPNTKKQLILDKRAFKIKSNLGQTVTDIGNISEALQREEAIFAAPLLNLAQSGRKVFGRNVPRKGVMESAISGIKGESFSPRRIGGQAEFGDVSEELLMKTGLPRSIATPISNVLGLAATEFLPSSRAIGSIGGSIVRKSAQTLANTTAKVVQKKFKNRRKFPFADLFRNKFRNAAESASIQEGVMAELMETGSGIDSDVILYAFRHPEALTEELARDEVMTDIVGSVTKKIKNKRLNSPELFNPTSNIPTKIANDITNQFKSRIKDVGGRVELTKKRFINKFGSEDFLSSNELELQVMNILGENDFLDKAGNIRDLKKNEATRFLGSVLKRVRGVTDKPEKLSKLVDAAGNPIVKQEASKRSLTLQESFDLIDAINEEAFKNAPIIDGVKKPLPEVEVVARQLRGRINDLIRSTADEIQFPELKQVFEEFSQLAQVRQNIPSNIRKNVSLAKFIRSIGNKNPEDLEQFDELIKATGSGRAIAKQIENFRQNQAIELTEQFPWLKSDKPIEIEKGLRSVLDKPIEKISAEESSLIQQLENILDDNFLELTVNHKIAKNFAGRSNIFRVGAASGLFNKATLPITGGIIGGVPGVVAGIAASDPRAQRALIRNSKSLLKSLNKVGEFAKQSTKITAKGSKIALRRQLQDSKR